MAGTISCSKTLLMFITVSMLSACGSSGEETTSTTPTSPIDDGSSEACTSPASALPTIFLEFNSSQNVTATLSSDGCSVTLESNGKPDHTSSYWDSANASGLYVAPENETLFQQQRSPGDIEDYINVYELTVPIEPELASRTSATPLGAIGIATSGAPIFNDSEGNGDVSLGVIQGFDRNGAHTGPETYHYHLEPRAITFDDDKLVGIMSDGFFIYGRRCFSSSDYPTDLDASNGHIAITQFTDSANQTGTYHYHVSNEQYLNGDYYLIFPGNFQGTPNGVR